MIYVLAFLMYNKFLYIIICSFSIKSYLLGGGEVVTRNFNAVFTVKSNGGDIKRMLI